MRRCLRVLNPAGFTAAQWYAVAHASRAVVNAPDGQRFFAAKTWLREGGYKGVVGSFAPAPAAERCTKCTATHPAGQAAEDGARHGAEGDTDWAGDYAELRRPCRLPEQR